MEIPLAFATSRTVQGVPAFGFRDKVRLNRGSNLFVFDLARAAGTQFVIKTLHAALKKTAPPFPDSPLGPLQTARDLGVAAAVRRPENDFRASDKGVQ